MTATRIARAATLAAATALWVFLASLLWRTTVPAHLRLPPVDERTAFEAGLVHDARGFERFLDWDWVAGTIAALIAYGVMVLRGKTLARKTGLSPVNAGIVLGLVTLTVVWAVELPFAVAGNWWERRHGISRETYSAELFGALERLLVITAIGFVALAIVLLLAQRFGRTWWIAAAPIVAATALGVQFVAPYVSAIGTHPARSALLRSEIGTLEHREQLGKPVVRVEDVSDTTTAANAFAVGFGPARHVFLWNTLLNGRFTQRQVRVAIGHELAHLARNHPLRGVAWFALFETAILAAVAVVADLRRPERVPVALLGVTVAQLAILPLTNTISRRYETEADWIGLDATRDPEAARGLFVGFVRTGLADPNPPGWVHVLLDDHPTPLQRVELARAWAERKR
jgi:Zn-dependent protease with chaperone function